ncbi:hypothetical protein E8E12_006716 [Didymella heteroderae]|uniref:Xylanolytic transcriptional activator regulatory domain-containing protein n=1 Tax=Didymella heteroderae TaxID=1769908 RepID=A0A9P4WRH1_9PLEO|nr:hypothetical protein E8E12_006716 [Didymella heteroderae]
MDDIERGSSHLSSNLAEIHGRETSVDPASQTCNSDPNTALEAKDPTDGIGSVVFTEEEDSAFLGPTSNIAFTRQIVRATNRLLHDAACAGTPISLSGPGAKNHVIHMSRPSSPGPDLLNHECDASIRADPFFLAPEREMTPLIELYFTTTGVLYPFIERRKFLETYQQLIEHGTSSVRRSWLGLLNMMLAMATSANFGYDPTITADTRKSRSDSFYRRAMILSDRQIRYATSLEVVQMLLLTSMYLQGTEHSVATWSVHGLAVKAAYQLGLHSPDALQQYSPPERELRKRVWYGCVVFDR